MSDRILERELAAEDCERRIAAALAVLDHAETAAEGPFRYHGLALLVAIRDALQPTPRVHVFGGVRFEETGEVRRPRREWATDSSQPDSCPMWFDEGDYVELSILRYAPEVGGE